MKVRHAANRVRDEIAGQSRDFGRESVERTKADHPDQSLEDVSRVQWRNSTPHKDLTWGRVLNGDAFIDKVLEHGGLTPGSSVLELGPGYGRLVRSAISKEIGFTSWCGVDISPANVDYLREEIADDRVSFVLEDIEKVQLNNKFDAFISSLTLKHLYPSFVVALSNVANHLNPGGRLYFDLLESTVLHRVLRRERCFLHGRLYIRRYRRSELDSVLGEAGLIVEGIDEVMLDAKSPRLFVVAKLG